MYNFVLQEDLKVYDEFIEKNKGQYIQCSRWKNVKTTWNCRYYCGFDEKGETVLATIPDEYTEMYNRMNTLFNSVANAIKGTVSGSVVRVDDVSPVEHKPVVKVICPEGVDPTTVTVRRCGKNLFNVNAIQTYATIVNNGDGTITAKSLVSQPVATLGEICPNLKAGDAATLSFVSPAVDATQSNKKLDFIYLIGTKESWYNGTTKTVTQEMLDNVIYFYASKNSEGNAVETRISNIQIEVGEVVTEYNKDIYCECYRIYYKDFSKYNTKRTILLMIMSFALATIALILRIMNPEVFHTVFASIYFYIMAIVFLFSEITMSDRGISRTVDRIFRKNPNME